MNYSLILCFIVAIFAAQDSSNIEDDFVIFKDSEEYNQWNKDSLGCIGLRGKLDPSVRYRIESKKITRRDVDRELGNPNLTHSEGSCYIYFVYSYCVDSSFSRKGAVLSIIFKNDSVVSVGGTIYGESLEQQK